MSAPRRALALSALLRRYPFGRGHGRIAQSRLVRWLVPNQSVDVWITLRDRDIRCLVPLNDLVGRLLFLFGDFDPWVTWAIEASCTQGDTVIDVGANLGAQTLVMAHCVAQEGRVLAFKPSPAVLRVLRQTISRNPTLPITLYENALGRTEGMMDLFLEEGNLGAGTLVASSREKPRAAHPVPVRRLADVLFEAGVENVALAKIDVEGFEADVLAGLFSRPDAVVPRIILLEEHAPRTSEAFRLLKTHDYHLCGLAKRLRGRPTLVAEGAAPFFACHDFVAIHACTSEVIRRRLGVLNSGENPIYNRI